MSDEAVNDGAAGIDGLPGRAGASGDQDRGWVVALVEKSILPITGSLLTFGDVSVVLRGGPALRLTLRDGKAFLVTVDDAATGAALLNDLIAGAT